MIYLETGSTNPYYNLAFEEYVLTHSSGDDYLILWQNENTIVVGQNQNTEEEINHDFVKQHQIKVVRRTTGGGAVYHDLGNLNYSFITEAGDAENLTMMRFTEPVVHALHALGLNAESSGRNDILVDGKKVSGTAQRISRNRILHHGTLLFDSDPDFIAGALHADPEKFKSKSTKSVRSRVGNIRDALQAAGKDWGIETFRDYLYRFLSGEHPGEKRTLSATEIRQIRSLQKEKYEKWEWNYGKSPKYDFRNTMRFAGGSVDVRCSVHRGLITEVKFYGDFLSTTSLDELEQSLVGCRFTQEAVCLLLERFDLEKYFGMITKEEITGLFA